ncbi:MAG: thiamine pyrophosphate-dependent dehydrogenase E1 component subunit alpha [Nitrospirae bacterium]|nr:thiamine pyrophosphate-dependent dehydrogenase E1 component subunit alpha [Nitrospirota bacterium]
MERDLELYHNLRLVREFEGRLSKMHHQGRIPGGVYSGLGQEALVVGSVYGLAREDFIFPLHRDLGAFLVKGVDPRLLMAQILGKKTGLSGGRDSFLHAGSLADGVFGATSMLASSLPVACGVALKFKMNGEPNVVLAFFGEGASSRGDVHEAMNFAGVQRLPVVFICENNFYAFSTPQPMEMAVEDVADRAAGYGFKGHVCNGNDLFAVMHEVGAAVELARRGGGPTLIECKTYRYSGHSEHDTATYRTKDELLEWESRDPIYMYEFYLQKKGHDMAALSAETGERVKATVDEAVKFAEDSPDPEGPEAMDGLYATQV